MDVSFSGVIHKAIKSGPPELDSGSLIGLDPSHKIGLVLSSRTRTNLMSQGLGARSSPLAD